MELLKKRPLAAALFAFFAGFFLLSNVPFVWRCILFGLSLGAGTVLLFAKKKRLLPIFTAFLLALAALLVALTSDLPDYGIGRRKGETVRYTFRALEQTDEEKNVWLVGSVKDENGALFCRLSVDLPDGLAVKPGDKLTAEGTVSSLSAYARNGLYGRGCRGRLHLSGDVGTVGHTVSLRAPFVSLAKTVRDTVASRVEGENGGLLVAVLLGETEELPIGTGLLFRRAGISHALAVSGMHLVFLSAALSFLLRRLGLPRPGVSVSVVLFAFFYAALVNFTPSVLRASLMLLFYEGGWFAKRQPDSLTSLALSGAVMLLFAPYLVASVSFLLSYLATLGILLSAQFIREKKPKKRPLPLSLARKIGSYALMTLFAVLFTLPVTCALFGEVTLLSIPANLLLSIPVQLLLYLAVAVLILPFPFVGNAAGRCCTVFLYLLRRIAALPLAPLSFSSKLLTFAGTLPILALLAVAFLGLTKRKRIVLCSFAGAFTLAAFLIFALPVKTDGHAVLLSDGNDSDLIVLRAGRSAACVDLGSPDGILPMLEKELKSDRIAELERYVVASYDKGSADRFREVLSAVYVRTVVLTEPTGSERAEYDALVGLLDRVSVKRTSLAGNGSVLGYELGFVKNDPPTDAPTSPLTLTLAADGDLLFYIGETVPILDEGYDLPDGTTALFLGCHGETRYFSFRQELPATVKAVYTGSEFYTTCAFSGGSPDLRLICKKRFLPDGFVP
ncbi:MAG: ComEC/Rec2 family competence protein [Clostridia bacterium]|nr:ComEC/Rec2 family competence protein [Clostridia bacterium]